MTIRPVTITMSREALSRALEALTAYFVAGVTPEEVDGLTEAYSALRDAHAQMMMAEPFESVLTSTGRSDR
jgi:hypothetical protein